MRMFMFMFMLIVFRHGMDAHFPATILILKDGLPVIRGLTTTRIYQSGVMTNEVAP